MLRTFGMVLAERFLLAFLRFTGEKEYLERDTQHQSTGYFDRNQETDSEDIERARMKVTRVCIYHVDHNAANTSHAIAGEIFAHMMFECVCHQVTIIGGDANRLAYQKAAKQLNSSYSMSTCQFWIDRMEHTLDRHLKDFLKTNKDMNV